MRVLQAAALESPTASVSGPALLYLAAFAFAQMCLRLLIGETLPCQQDFPGQQQLSIVSCELDPLSLTSDRIHLVQCRSKFGAASSDAIPRAAANQRWAFCLVEAVGRLLPCQCTVAMLCDVYMHARKDMLVRCHIY